MCSYPCVFPFLASIGLTSFTSLLFVLLFFMFGQFFTFKGTGDFITYYIIIIWLYFNFFSCHILGEVVVFFNVSYNSSGVNMGYYPFRMRTRISLP